MLVKITIKKDTLRKAIVSQMVANTAAWKNLKGTKKWYDHIFPFTDYHFAYFQFKDTSERLNQYLVALDVHIEETVIIDKYELDFILEGQSV